MRKDLFAAIDLHSNNNYLTVIDSNDRRVVERRLRNELPAVLSVLEPYGKRLAGVAVESTFNWYWLVDGLSAAGHAPRLVNTSAVRKYEGLKNTDDRHDAFWLAYLMRLDILPTATSWNRRRVLCAICCANECAWSSSGARTSSASRTCSNEMRVCA